MYERESVCVRESVVCGGGDCVCVCVKEREIYRGRKGGREHFYHGLLNMKITR